MTYLFVVPLSFATLLMVRCTALSSKFLDVSKVPLYGVAEVFKGNFKDGGTYRMIHHKSGFVPEVVYEYKRMKTTNRSSKTFDDLYIEEYRRGDAIFMEFIGVYKRKNGNSGLRVRIYEVRSDKVKLSTRSALSSFIDGGVLLHIDMAALSETHPFVQRLCESDNYDIRKCLNMGGLELVRNEHVKLFRKSPYYTSFSFAAAMPPDAFGMPMSSIISNSNKIVRHSNMMDYSVFLQNGGMDVEYVVNPITGAVHLKDDSTMDGSKYWKPFFSNPLKLIRQISIRIRVGIPCDYNPHIMLLSNVPKGEWLYSRYHTVPYGAVSVLNTTVLNGNTGLMIYQSRQSTFVTSVEVFVHHGHEWEYIIVNFQRLRGFGIVKGARIYTRMMNTIGKYVYTNITGARKKVYTELIASIYNEPGPNYLPTEVVGI